jgi:hypothetical protein
MTTTQQRQWAIQEARRSLARASSVGEVKRIRAAADALRLAAKSEQGDTKTVRLAAELRLLCERKLGKLLAAMPLRGGDRRSTKHALPGLAAMGVSRVQSSRWQREASVPDHRFRQYLQEAVNNEIEPTAKGLLRLAEVSRAANGSQPFADVARALRSFARNGKTFGCILVVPPDEASSRLRRLASLPVGQVAAANAHLHLWTVPEALDDALWLLKAWGFRYASCLACAAEPTSGGAYWQQAHRDLLLGVRGRVSFRDTRIPSRITDRSIKPDSLRRLLERVSPSPRLDVFGTKATAGWTLALGGR